MNIMQELFPQFKNFEFMNNNPKFLTKFSNQGKIEGRVSLQQIMRDFFKQHLSSVISCH